MNRRALNKLIKRSSEIQVIVNATNDDILYVQVSKSALLRGMPPTNDDTSDTYKAQLFDDGMLVIG